MARHAPKSASQVGHRPKPLKHDERHGRAVIVPSAHPVIEHLQLIGAENELKIRRRPRDSRNTGRMEMPSFDYQVYRRTARTRDDVGRIGKMQCRCARGPDRQD
jgi:hypothetical protein